MTVLNQKALLFFPRDYAHSRSRFLLHMSSLAHTSESGSWNIPSDFDQELFVDYLYLPPLEKFQNLIVITSGIHGLETYAGSAIQEMFLTDILPYVDRSQVGFLIVHCMNPYGFKYHRRCTEKHVNLNRNFSLYPNLFQTPNEDSLRFQDLLIPRNPVGSLNSLLMQRMSQNENQIRFGLDQMGSSISMDALVKAVSPGQFKRSDALEFGGTEPEPQTRSLVNWLKQNMPNYQKVILLDLHTGLGQKGRLHLLTSGEINETNRLFIEDVFRQHEDQDAYEFTPSSAEGFYKTHGALNNVFLELCQPDQQVAAITLEFGTLGHDLKSRLESLNRWFIEHQGIHFGFSDPEIESQARTRYLEKFYPKDTEWRLDVVSSALTTIWRICERLKIAPTQQRD